MSSLTSGTQETQPYMDVAEILEKNETCVGEFVPLSDSQKATLRRVFMPALVLLKSLNDICALGDRSTEDDPPPDTYQSPEKKFQTFVNKVAQICDSLPKGSTVTACTVLEQENGRVLYLFASNNRKTKSLREMAMFVVSVFDVLKKNISVPPQQKESDQVLNDRLLRMVLAFNHVRVRTYISALATHIKTCIKRCAPAPGDEHDALILESLKSLLQAIPLAAQDRKQKSEEFADDVSHLILAIQSYQETPAQQLIQQRALALKSDKGNCWALARHAAGRLVSYRYAAETLTQAHHIWADKPLFLEYDIGFLHSSSAGDDPLVEKRTGRRTDPLTADDIINRMTSNRPNQQRYKALAESLQMATTTAGSSNSTSTSTSTAAAAGNSSSSTSSSNNSDRKLDTAIAAQWQRSTPSRVHSEVLLVDYLQHTPGHTRAHRFFGGTRYIGASKATCRLCRYYFDTCAPEVATRPTHNNVYYGWRHPDTYRLSGDPRRPREGGGGGEPLTPAETRWRDAVGQIKALVCKDVFRLLEGQVKDATRVLDSNTYTERIRQESRAGGVSLAAPSLVEVDVLSGAMRGMEM